MSLSAKYSIISLSIFLTFCHKSNKIGSLVLKDSSSSFIQLSGNKFLANLNQLPNLIDSI